MWILNKIIMKIYLDNSAYNRIFDDQSQPRIYFEASAMLLIFFFIEKGNLILVSSDAVNYENQVNPFEKRKMFVENASSRARFFQQVEKKTLKRAREIEQLTSTGMDALHLVCAEEQSVDTFITWDDNIIKKYSDKIIVQTPVKFIENFVMRG